MSIQEAARLRALRSYRAFGTPPEEALDRIASLAADLFQAPLGLVTLLDDELQWIKGRHGTDLCSTSRQDAFCAHALPLAPGEVLIVEDALEDERFKNNPFVVGEPHVRFYAGAVLTGNGGHNLGTLCIIDYKPRPRPTVEELARLSTLASLVVRELELHRVRQEQENRQHLLDLAEAMSGVGHWSFDVETGEMEWSDHVYKIHGVDRDSFTPCYKAAVQFYHPDDQASLRELVGRAIKTGAGYQFSLRLLRPDGQLRHVTASATCELDHNGKVVALFGVFQDVTEHVAARAAAERDHARYKLLADHAADVITRIRLDGSSSYISPAVETLLGYRPEEMRGLPAHAFVTPEDRPLIANALACLTAQQPDTTVEVRAMRKPGDCVWVEVRFRAIFDEGGRVVEAVAVIRDVDARKHLEAELRQARADAEAAAEVKADFLANMSHELRTPLTAVIGFSKLAREQVALDSPALGLLDRSVSAGKALLSTVNDILDFSKLEAGQVEIRPVRMAPAEVVHNVLDVLSFQAEAKGVDLRFAPDIDLPPLIQADPDRLRQILLNLVSNALKFTDSGAVEVRARQDGPGYVRFEVEDTGCGIPPERTGELFKRFSQVDGSSTRRHGGTGLGLAICKGLAEMMGGEVGVRSEPGKGSCFWFTVHAPPVTPAQSGGHEQDLEGLRILVVDDNSANRELVRAFLQPFGAEVDTAEDGPSSIRLASEKPYDCILLDVRMPGMAGPEAAGKIRSGGGPNADIPILAFSADLPPPGARHLFDGYVSKPISAAQLIHNILAAASFVQDAADHAA